MVVVEVYQYMAISHVNMAISYVKSEEKNAYKNTWYLTNSYTIMGSHTP